MPEPQEPTEGEEEPPEYDPTPIHNVVRVASHAMVLATARATGEEDPYLSISQQHRGADPDAETKLLLTVLTAGKESGSKVKFSHIYAIINPHPKDNVIELY